MTLDEVESAARQLPEHERIELAQRLFEALVGDEPLLGAWFDDTDAEGSRPDDPIGDDGRPPPYPAAA